jgi:hypothetical protein
MTRIAARTAECTSRPHRPGRQAAVRAALPRALPASGRSCVGRAGSLSGSNLESAFKTNVVRRAGAQRSRDADQVASQMPYGLLSAGDSLLLDSSRSVPVSCTRWRS